MSFSHPGLLELGVTSLWQIKVLNEFLTLCKFEFANAFGNKTEVELKDFKSI